MTRLRIFCLLALAALAAPLTSCSQTAGLAGGAVQAAESAPRSITSTLGRTLQSVGRTAGF